MKKKDNTGPSCSSCLYFRKRIHDGEYVQDECRRFPPAVMAYADANGDTFPMTSYPSTEPDDWCGEFRGAQ